MAIIIKFKEGQKQVWHLVSLQELQADMKRSMTMQLKELIDEIEDCEAEGASIGSVHIVRFLDNCYLAA
jgi:L-serine deaminase